MRLRRRTARTSALSRSIAPSRFWTIASRRKKSIPNCYVCSAKRAYTKRFCLHAKNDVPPLCSFRAESPVATFASRRFLRHIRRRAACGSVGASRPPAILRGSDGVCRDPASSESRERATGNPRDSQCGWKAGIERGRRRGRTERKNGYDRPGFFHGAFRCKRDRCEVVWSFGGRTCGPDRPERVFTWVFARFWARFWARNHGSCRDFAARPLL